MYGKLMVMHSFIHSSIHSFISCRYVAKDEKQKQEARMAEMQAEACNWPQAVQLRLTALGMPPLSRIGIAGNLLHSNTFILKSGTSC